MRPLPQDDADPVAAKDGWNYQPNANPLPPHTKFTFAPFDATKAPTFNPILMTRRPYSVRP
jgi:hypothetical protein